MSTTVLERELRRGSAEILILARQRDVWHSFFAALSSVARIRHA
jgi:hypothetical protein